MTEIDGFDQPLSRADHIVARGGDPKEVLLDAQMVAMAERAKDPRLFAKNVHFAMAYELACGRPIRHTMTSGIKTPKATSTNNLRYTTCKKCLHSLSNLALAQLDLLLAVEKEQRLASQAV